jgi:hypothetical protein
VRSWFQRLFAARSPRRAPVTCYLRENGPLAYQLDLFGDTPRDAAETLLSSGLAWAWTSGTREWTHLTRISLSAFLADLPGGALLVAVEGELPTHLTGDVVKDWVRRFCRIEPVPLAVAISATPAPDPKRRNSPGQQLVFVQQHASAPVNALLDALHLDRRAAARSAYARLGPSSLESIAERL